MATTRKSSIDEEFDVFVSSYTDDDDDDDDSCSNETEDDDVRLATDNHRHGSPTSTMTSRNMEIGQQNGNHVSSSTNTKKFSIASILGTETDGQTVSEYENKREDDDCVRFVRPTPLPAVLRPPPLNAAAAVALYPGSFFTPPNSYASSASNSGLMLEMISPNSLSCSNEHSGPYSSLSYPASLASASAASLLYGGWFAASTANKAPSQLFGLQGKIILTVLINKSFIQS
jgi:hypothetical protein